MAIHIAVLSAFTAALLAPVVQRMAGRRAGYIVALVPLALFLFFTSHVEPISRGDVFAARWDWIPALGVNLTFRLDGWGLLFSLLISGIGTLVVLYASAYLAGRADVGRFYVYVLVFMASMLGVALSDNILALFVFWELTSLSSFLLIGFDHERAEARAGALQSLVVTSGGGLAMLAGLVILSQVGGSMELSVLAGSRDAVATHGLYPAIVALVAAGAFAKSAQVPFHFWLPNAMQAPSPVSAYLHSATMVKAGVYLLARLSLILGGTLLWQWTLIGFGATTVLLGALLAVRQTDLKRILAYSTISALGTLVMLIGVGTALAMEAMVLFLLAHALYKGALFLVAGAIDHETGTRQVDRLGGLRAAMPVTAMAAGLAAFSMAGLPPALGFLGKELYYDAALHSGEAVLIVLAVAGSILMVAIAGAAGLAPFAGAPQATPKKAHEAPPAMYAGPLLLAGLGLAAGIYPQTLSGLTSAAASALLGKPVVMKLALWHGLTPVLGLTVLTIAVGALLFVKRDALRRSMAWIDAGSRWGSERWYTSAINGLNTLASGQTRLLQSGYLRYYLTTIIAFTVLLGGHALLRSNAVALPEVWLDVRFYELAVVGLIIAGTLVAVRSDSRLGAVVSLGVVGYGIALIFILFGAPDLAMTQFMIETLTVILLVLVFYHLPRFAHISGTPARLRDVVVALSAGALVSVMVLVAIREQFFAPISSYFIENSLPLAHGRNVVNVILVDFRALDTLGEITVLALAGLGVYALLKLRPGRRDGK